MDELKNTKLKEQIMDILQKYFHSGCDEDLPIDEASFVADEILALFPDTTKMSQSNDRLADLGKTISYPNDYLREYGRTVHKGGGR